MKKKYLTSIAVLVSLLCAGFFVQAKAADILGCYLNGHGQLRIVDNLDECLKSETPITLNQSVAMNDYQEYCWQLQTTEDENGPTEGEGLLRMGFTETGGDFYLVQGIVSDTGPGDYPVIFSGSAVEVEDEIFINISHSQEHGDSPWRDAGVSQMRLNAQTMSGTYWGTRVDFQTLSREFDIAYGAGNVTLVSCP